MSLQGSEQSSPSMDLSSLSSDGSQATLGSGFSEQTFGVTNVDILCRVRSNIPPTLPLRMELKYDGFEVVRTKENTGFDESMRKLKTARKEMKAKMKNTESMKESAPSQIALSYDTYARAYLKERKKRKKQMAKKIERERQLLKKSESQKYNQNGLEEIPTKEETRKSRNKLYEIGQAVKKSDSRSMTSYREIEENAMPKKRRKTNRRQKRTSRAPAIEKKIDSRKDHMRSITNIDRIDENSPATPFQWLEDLTLAPFLASACSCKENVLDKSDIMVPRKNIARVSSSTTTYTTSSMRSKKKDISVITKAEIEAEEVKSTASNTPIKSNTLKSRNLFGIRADYSSASISPIGTYGSSFSIANESSRSIRMKGISREFLRKQAEDIVSGRFSATQDDPSALDEALSKNSAIDENRDQLSCGKLDKGDEYFSTSPHDISNALLQDRRSKSSSLYESINTDENNIHVRVPNFVGESTMFHQGGGRDHGSPIGPTVTNSTIGTTSLHDQMDNVMITFSSGSGSQLEVDHSHGDCGYDEREPNGSDRSDENRRENSFASVL